ncbi:MAG: hypothetical protein U0354_05345 [Candidatus Sericytochromatia bacterium]
MSENIFATSYNTAEEALKTASQIRRTSLVIQENSGYWKLLLTNNRVNISKDLSSMDLAEYDSFVNINDSQGNILRNKVQLNSESLKYYAKLISNFSSQDNLLTKEFGDATRRFKALISAIKEEVVEKESVQEDRSGVYELRPIEFYCYYKKCRPVKILLQQKLNNECYESFILQLTFNDKVSVDCILPLIRKAKLQSKEVNKYVSQGKSVQILIELRQSILDKIKYIMFGTLDLESIMNMRNPLNRPILTDLSNYKVNDVKII